ncbi:hypothetical protein EI94DRAFT_1700195 [Lactarius quietus]|nr:hypothetical protein EI94DRAFT_1700195 [Lactarius quietus]
MSPKGTISSELCHETVRHPACEEEPSTLRLRFYEMTWKVESMSFCILEHALPLPPPSRKLDVMSELRYGQEDGPALNCEATVAIHAIVGQIVSRGGKAAATPVQQSAMSQASESEHPPSSAAAKRQQRKRDWVLNSENEWVVENAAAREQLGRRGEHTEDEGRHNWIVYSEDTNGFMYSIATFEEKQIQTLSRSKLQHWEGPFSVASTGLSELAFRSVCAENGVLLTSAVDLSKGVRGYPEKGEKGQAIMVWIGAEKKGNQYSEMSQKA